MNIIFRNFKIPSFILKSPSASSKELSYRVSRRVRDKADIPDKVEKARQAVHREIKQKVSWIRRKGLAGSDSKINSYNLMQRREPFIWENPFRQRGS